MCGRESAYNGDTVVRDDLNTADLVVESDKRGGERAATVAGEHGSPVVGPKGVDERRLM
jgi:hypothetical protein